MFENLSDILRAPEKISFFTSSVRFKLWMYLNSKDLRMGIRNDMYNMRTNNEDSNLQWWWIFSILSLNQPVGFLEKNMSKVTKICLQIIFYEIKKSIWVFCGFIMIQKIMIAFKLCLKVSKRNYQMKFKQLEGFPNEYISSSW